MLRKPRAPGMRTLPDATQCNVKAKARHRGGRPSRHARATKRTQIALKNRAEVIVDKELESWRTDGPGKRRGDNRRGEGARGRGGEERCRREGSLTRLPLARSPPLVPTQSGQEVEHGTEVDIVLEARFLRGRASVDECLETTAIANPHAQIHYVAPDGLTRGCPRGHRRYSPARRPSSRTPTASSWAVLIRMFEGDAA